MKKFTILLVIVFSINLAIAADCHFDLPGDINNDCKTDLADFVIIANTWLIDCDVNNSNINRSPLDLDGDGFDAIADCNDSSSGVYPGAIEFCDNIDNNCDGLIDNDCITALFVSKTGNDLNPGSITDPKLSIQAAIDASATQGNIDIFVSNGTYVEQISLKNDSGFETPSVQATCNKCGHITESFGDLSSSVKRCLVLMNEECPRREHNFYKKDENSYDE